MIECAPHLLEATAEIPAGAWDRIYDLDPAALPSQSSIWARTLTRTSGAMNRSRWYRFSDGVEAILPLFAARLAPAALSVLASPPPAWGFGGPISSRPLGAAHLALILEDCAAQPGAAVRIRPNPQLADIWADAARRAGWQGAERMAHVLDLSGGFETVWSDRCPGKTRTKIRKAEKLGVTLETGQSPALVDAFDALFRQSVLRWARRQNEFGWLAEFRARRRDPKSKLHDMVRRSGGLAEVSIASYDGRPVAGIIVLTGQNAHYTRGAMDERVAGQVRANYLLQMNAIQRAADAGCRSYHMGETAPGSSLAQFKSSFGAEAVPYAEYTVERLPILSADQRARTFVKRMIGMRDA